ncbi:MAG: SGNH/GDSL hydrolase family protein [Pirellulaceae bacterium]
MRHLGLILTCSALWFAGAGSAWGESIELKDGDRVVWLGGAFVERMQASEFVETAITAGYPNRRITFRNLGWSGDTVFGEARAVFGSAEDGFRRLLKDTTEAKPTVLLIAYGANEAHAGEAGLEHFTQGLNRLLNELAKTDARMILLLPRGYEQADEPLPSPTEYNAKLQLYRARLAEVAKQRELPTVDLQQLSPVDERLTNNGVHLTPDGYKTLAPRLAAALGATPISDFARLEPMRQAIQKKNELYFHRYRPQNETYLFLFRKHEQGNNAVEIPQFDPLVQEQEDRIAEFRESLTTGS